jgi:hypothetical protein
VTQTHRAVVEAVALVPQVDHLVAVQVHHHQSLVLPQPTQEVVEAHAFQAVADLVLAVQAVAVQVQMVRQQREQVDSVAEEVEAGITVEDLVALGDLAL